VHWYVIEGQRRTIKTNKVCRTNDVRTKEVRTNDVRTKEVRTNDVRTKNARPT
jgi:hypothetical protein